MVTLRFTLALLCAAAIVASAERDRSASPQIVVFGDSLTSGHGVGADRAYPAFLQQRLDEAGLDYAVVNAGISGDTSGRAVRRLERALRGNIRILIIALGANDGLRGVPVPQLKENLAQIIETAQARGIAVLLCGMEALPVHGWAYTVAFHKVYRDLAARYDVPLVPFMLMNVIDNPQLMQPDQIHPNAEGARRIANNIWPYLKPLAEDVAAATVQR